MSASVLAACSGVGSRPERAHGQHSSVQAHELAAPADERYRHSGDVTYTKPMPAGENPMPAYPAELLAQRLPPRTIAARLIFDAQGEVAEVRPLADDDSLETEAFMRSIRTAADSWHYTTLVERRRVTGAGSAFAAMEVEIVETPMPFRLDFAFTFTQSDGRGTVELELSPGEDDK
ncbi:hypothetical protein ACQQ2N_16200 [Dokdonella sp. MW10]|uniref:hypothetical protein n=1 Tax=Dokdonella sp. MW10 TaxID=2992926 RepID=UPI003F823827